MPTNLTADEKRQFRKKLTDLKLNIEHTKRATMLGKAAAAEKTVADAVACIELIMQKMGAFDD